MKLLALILSAFPLTASADSFYVLVGYVCDRHADELRLTYDGAYNERGEELLANKAKTQWDPWQLTVAKDDDHIGSIKTVRARCRLSDGTYEIQIKPSPGNFNVQGRCGAWITAGATVSKGRKTVYSIRRFDNDCHDTTTPIVTRVVVGPNLTAPSVTSVSSEEFYK